MVRLDHLPTLAAEAAGLALVLFSSTMVAARSFADRNHYEIDADREIAALGVANLASAFTQGFAVTGTNSRTAIGEAAGGRTQVTGIAAAVTIAVVLFAFTGPLKLIPRVALAAVLVMAGASLFNWSAVATIRRIDRREFRIATTATIGVIAVGPMNAILVAVALALLSFVQLASRPRSEILGAIAGQPGFHSLERNPEAATPQGLVLFRFDGPVVFFNAPYFKREVQKAVLAAGPGLKWFVIDLLPVNSIDATGIYAVQEVFADLCRRGIVAGAAARETQWADWAGQRGYSPAARPDPLLPDAGAGSGRVRGRRHSHRSPAGIHQTRSWNGVTSIAANRVRRSQSWTRRGLQAGNRKEVATASGGRRQWGAPMAPLWPPNRRRHLGVRPGRKAQARALALSFPNSSWLMAPESRSALASAICSAGDFPATRLM